MAQVITNAGKAFLLASLVGNSLPTLYVGWGTGAGTSAPTDTALFSEDSGGSPAYARIAATISLVTTNTTNDTLQMTASIQSNGGKTITNAGIFTNLSGGTLLWHSDFPGYALNGGDTLQFTYDWIL